MLEAVTKQFNNSLAKWREVTGCTVNFSWKYNPAGDKVLVVSEIDLPVFRGAAPDAGNLASTIAKYSATK